MLWFDGPTIVDQVEWANHAEKWRKSIDTGHGSPDGRDTSPRYYDGTYLKAIDAVHEAEWEKINAWLKKHISISLTDSSTAGVGGPVSN